MIKRECCVFCNNTKLEIIHTENNYPIALYGCEKIETYEYLDLIYASCSDCKIVQMTNLIIPDKLYKINFNNTAHLPIWIKHHKLFFDFINKNNIDKTNFIIDIGGGNNALSKYFQYIYNNYTVLDIFETHNKLEKIHYIIGNCETYNYTNCNTIIMSHVFEHLYYPRNFLNKVKNKGVTNIFISIPNMKKCVENNSICHVSSGHTFYYEEDNIIKLFNEFSYKLKDTYIFDDHSIFFYFSLCLEDKFNINNMIIPDKNSIINIKNNLINLAKTISSLNFNKDNDIFILPAGGYGSKIYYYLNDNNKNKVIGFLDNDTTKHGKYLYGTSKIIYSLDYIKSYISPIIIVNAGAHTNNVIKNINDINSSAIIYNLYANIKN